MKDMIVVCNPFAITVIEQFLCARFKKSKCTFA
jgi:hypothetical protein